MSQIWQNTGKGEVFPEITKAAPGRSPLSQDHVAKLKKVDHQRPATLLWKSPAQALSGEQRFPLFEVSGRPGRDRAWSEAAVSGAWPTQPPVGNKDKTIKRGSHGSGSSRGPTEMLVNSPASGSRQPEFQSSLFGELCVTLGKLPNVCDSVNEDARTVLTAHMKDEKHLEQ